jgi:competence ComEA-like helix-hairpin-helix protein
VELFNLTPQEKKTILFLLIILALGIGIDFLSKILSQAPPVALILENTAKIDLNQADQKMLKDIPGIGEKLSQRIIDYRNNEGGFSSLEELKDIKGITQKRYEELTNWLYIEK